MQDTLRLQLLTELIINTSKQEQRVLTLYMMQKD